ncbi:hypothetical protein HQQ80_20190 [Microbacteriaceae bacterium VKM Ac-2855]|nr:hypothetical protein [Microbacteriaceae bacterium VKM Ac-2855]
MFDESTLTLPPRRNVKAMTETLAGLADGDLVTMTVSTPRYGPVAYAGTVTLSPSAKSFFLAGLTIENNLKPDKFLQSLEVTHRVAEHWDPDADDTPSPAVAPRSDDLAAVLSTLEHGALVEAVVSHGLYGEVTIAGPAVLSVLSGGFRLGSWMLGTPAAAAPALRTLRVIAPAGAHAVPVPPRITTVDEDPLPA